MTEQTHYAIAETERQRLQTEVACLGDLLTAAARVADVVKASETTHEGRALEGLVAAMQSRVLTLSEGLDAVTD